MRVVRDAAARSAEGEGRPHDHRIADVLRKGQRILHRLHHRGGDYRLADSLHRVLEHLPVLGLVDGIKVGAEQRHPVFRQKTLPGELHRQGQSGLTAQRGQQAVRLFLLNDPPYRLKGERLNVYVIGHRPVGHDGGGVGVDQHHLQPLFPERAASLGAAIVKFCRLPDDNRPGADYQNLVQLRI